jgi:hypothetical protein
MLNLCAKDWAIYVPVDPYSTDFGTGWYNTGGCKSKTGISATEKINIIMYT